MSSGSLAKLAATVGLAALLLPVAVGRAAAAGPVPAGLDPELEERIKAAIDVGLSWLSSQQQGDGSWGSSAAVTALAVRAFVESPRRYTADDGPFVRNAFAYLKAASRPDGAFGGGGREETALVLLAHGGTLPSTHPVWKVLSQLGGGKDEAQLFELLGGSTAGVPREETRELAERILAAQEFAGSWPPRSADPAEGDRLVATSLALLALERIYED